MKTVYNSDHTSVRIYGDFSPHPVIIDTDAVESLGGIESAFHRIKYLQSKHFMPRMGSEKWPLSCFDYMLACRNEFVDRQAWKYFTLSGVKEYTGYDFVNGYGYERNGTIYLRPDWDNDTEFVIPVDRI